MHMPGPAWRLSLPLLLLMASAGLPADELRIEVTGVKKSLLANVNASLEGMHVSGKERLSERRLARIAADAERAAVKALRPYGYYHATASSERVAAGAGKWRLLLEIDEGPPAIVSAARVEVTGPGAGLTELMEWKQDWPLPVSKRLDQVKWETWKARALDLAEADGYLLARFTEHEIRLDIERNTAELALVLDTGPQAVMGTVTFEQNVVRAGILELVPRFAEGQAYAAWLLDRLRLDLWRTGYFGDVEVVEERRLEETPPRVNLVVRAAGRKRNTYQGSLGYGTDTGARAQVLWTRHLLSDRGDSLSLGLGWQQTNREYSLRGGYRIPRASTAREFWTADLYLRRENQDLEIRADEDGADFTTLANGDVADYSLKAGRLIVRDFEQGRQQIFETWYGQYLLEKNTFEIRDPDDAGGATLREQDLDALRETGSSLAFGINWDWPAIRGSGFGTVGHHERAWVFTANEAWGSDTDFSQAYLSSTWNRLLGRRWKLLLRGEAGYSDARVAELEATLDGQVVQLSATELPNLYRFKAGGSRSVRGYDFESLSNNGLGSNHVLTLSAELEMRLVNDWSLAAFFDAGNAFNDWSKPGLKQGAGVGIRWYSPAGPVRLDFAQALDLDGDPWSIHFALGTPLL